jgi:catechol 2,3-dioxygenase-like lactoylglutathione lyase family enzyme
LRGTVTQMATEETTVWSIGGLVIAVRDLERSVPFYEDVMSLREVMRDGEVALLEGSGSFRLYLRGSHGQGTRPGRQALGPRVVSFDVGSASELDRVEERLRALGSFRTRQSLSLHEDLEVVFGFDPDRLALTFATPPTGQPEVFDRDRSVQAIYSADT